MFMLCQMQRLVSGRLLSSLACSLPGSSTRSTTFITSTRHVRSVASRDNPFAIDYVEKETVKERSDRQLLDQYTQEVTSQVNRQLSEQKAGRLFAVVYIGEKQFKVSENDLIVLQHDRPLDVGDEIRLHKVMMVGSKEFSVFGRPLLSLDSVTVKAVVVEKTLTNVEPYSIQVPRKLIRILKLLRYPLTVLRITEIKLDPSVTENSPTQEDSS